MHPVETALANQGLLNVWARLCDIKKCPFCSKPYPDGLVKRDPGGCNALISGEWAFHCFSVHGYAPEDLTMFVRESAATLNERILAACTPTTGRASETGAGA